MPRVFDKKHSCIMFIEISISLDAAMLAEGEEVGVVTICVIPTGLMTRNATAMVIFQDGTALSE